MSLFKGTDLSVTSYTLVFTDSPAPKVLTPGPPAPRLAPSLPGGPCPQQPPGWEGNAHPLPQGPGAAEAAPCPAGAPRGRLGWAARGRHRVRGGSPLWAGAAAAPEAQTGPLLREHSPHLPRHLARPKHSPPGHGAGTPQGCLLTASPSLPGKPRTCDGIIALPYPPYTPPRTDSACPVPASRQPAATLDCRGDLAPPHHHLPSLCPSAHSHWGLSVALSPPGGAHWGVQGQHVP